MPQPLTSGAGELGTDVKVLVRVYDIRTDMHLIMEMGTGGKTGVTNVSNDLALLHPIPDL
jgi:hypothetical protein